MNVNYISSKGSVPKINSNNFPLCNVQMGAFFMRMPGVEEAWDALNPPKENPEQRLGWKE